MVYDTRRHRDAHADALRGAEEDRGDGREGLGAMTLLLLLP